MTAFPLANLDAALLEMVITKLDNKNEITCYKKRYNGVLDGVGCYDAYDTYKQIGIDLDTLYGTRLSKLKLYEENGFEPICDCLKKYRLTFAKVDYRDKWTKEQILTILKMTKPPTIFLNSEGSNAYEALFHSKSLKKVNVELNQEQVATVVPKLLCAFPEVFVKISAFEDMFGLLCTVLQILRSQPLPNLRKFDFYTKGNMGAINTDRDDLEKQFREFNLTVKKDFDDYLEAAVELPPHFPEGTYCKVTFRRSNYVHLYCGVGDVTDALVKTLPSPS